jgi:hypothetical protein
MDQCHKLHFLWTKNSVQFIIRRVLFNWQILYIDYYYYSIQLSAYRQQWMGCLPVNSRDKLWVLQFCIPVNQWQTLLVCSSRTAESLFAQVVLQTASRHLNCHLKSSSLLINEELSSLPVHSYCILWHSSFSTLCFNCLHLNLVTIHFDFLWNIAFFCWSQCPL